ncbi:MAG: hypothetical protein AAFY01_13010, partial [Pseudomonadota bacterium]
MALVALSQLIPATPLWSPVAAQAETNVPENVGCESGLAQTTVDFREGFFFPKTVSLRVESVDDILSLNERRLTLNFLCRDNVHQFDVDVPTFSDNYKYDEGRFLFRDEFVQIQLDGMRALIRKDYSGNRSLTPGIRSVTLCAREKNIPLDQRLTGDTNLPESELHQPSNTIVDCRGAVFNSRAEFRAILGGGYGCFFVASNRLVSLIFWPTDSCVEGNEHSDALIMKR